MQPICKMYLTPRASPVSTATAALASLHELPQAPTFQRPALRPAPGLAAPGRGALSATAALLAELPLFAALTEAQREWLAARASVRHFRRGDRVVEQGRTQDNLFVLLNGKAHAMRSGANGRSLLLQVLRRGDFFGELGIIDGLPHGGSVRCLVQCDMLVLPGRDIDRQLLEWPSFAETMVRVLVQRLRGANRRIASLALHDVHDRVIDYLRDNGEPVGDGSYHVRGRVSRTEMAFMVGASREMVCRVMRQLGRRGIADARDDGSIVVRPPQDG